MDLRGSVAVVTGASSGIGRVTAEKLAESGARVLLACRSEERTTGVVDAIRRAGGDSRFVHLDLGDLASVRACASRILEESAPLRLLVNNAGLAGQRGITASGFELAFGTNHVGHFLLTLLLLDRLRESGSARIVNVASQSHHQAKDGIDFEAVRRPTRSLTGMPEYAVSKLANVLFTAELARRLGKASSVTSYALHPGVVATNVWRGLPAPLAWVIKHFMLSEEDGAKTSLFCATSDAVADHDGRYYDDCRERRPSRMAQDESLAERLFRQSEAWTGVALSGGRDANVKALY